jgi:putative ABC transport system permease protein
MSKWLEAFSYRIAPSVWIFIASGVSTLTLAILITGYHSVKAALMNPVEVLRDE